VKASPLDGQHVVLPIDPGERACPRRGSLVQRRLRYLHSKGKLGNRAHGEVGAPRDEKCPQALVRACQPARDPRDLEDPYEFFWPLHTPGIFLQVENT
jgi:hypothetical protein